jgi:SH3-like domain-containing protein
MTISRSRSLVGVLALALACALTAVLVAPAVHASTAHVARASARYKSCDVSNVADRLGPTSVSSLKVIGVRCGIGISVVRAFHSCRLANGPSGRCVRLVKGYACQELRTNAPTQINGTVTCRKGRKTVFHRYTQNL